jgi:hypothetical protein
MSETSGPETPSEPSGHETQPEMLENLRQVIRAQARDAEANRSRNLAVILVVLAVAVAAMAGAHDRTPGQYGRLSAVLLEGVFLLVAFVTAQVSAGRLIQGRRTLTPDLPPDPPSGPGSDELDSQDNARGWRPQGWFLFLVPVLLFVWIVRACRIDFQGPFYNKQLAAISNSHPIVAAWVLAGLTAALAVVIIAATVATRRLDRPQSAGPDGRESESQTLPARGAEAHRRVAPVSAGAPVKSGDGTTWRESEGVRSEAATKAPVVVAFSGGGLRSASFCLGGFNAVQRLSMIDNVDALVAVSGGGYAASAISLTRSFAGTEKPPPPPDPPGPPTPPPPPDPLPRVDDVYSLPSPELAYLRRNSRYIFQPPWRTVSGVWQLIGGALINLFLFVMALLTVAWLLGWYWWAVAFVGGMDTNSPHADLASWSHWPWWASAFLVIAALGAIAGLLFAQILRRNSDVKAPSSALWARSMAAASRAFLVLLVVTVLLPVLVFGLSRMAYGNEPSAVVAKGIVSLGLTQKPACSMAIGSSARSAYVSARSRARVSQQRESESYGGCGKSGSLTYDPAQPTPFDRISAIASVGGAPTAGGGGQLVSLLVIVVAALGSLRRGYTSVGAALGGRFAAVRRWLLLRLPLAAVSLVALWLVMLWSYRYAIEGPAQSLAVPAELIVLALIVQLMNPNLTSIHEFYRERLSSAFAVGRDNNDPQIARNLPYSTQYNLSELETAPELVLCTTANINDQKVVPTRRFGVPLTFSSTKVRLESGGLVPDLGYQATDEVEKDRRWPQLTVMAASAISGAAVSPLMGRMGGKVAPFRLLLTLFNVRLGVWVMNPRWPLGEAAPPWWAPMATQPRFHQLFSEAFGSTTIDDRWIYLTDGGHLDNLGLVEAVRRLPDRVLALSASNDAPGSWQDVGAAVSVLRADLDIDLQVIARDRQDTWMRLRGAKPPGHDGIGTIDVLIVKASLTTQDWPLDDKDPVVPRILPPIDERMPIDVRSFATRDASFPRTSTGRQDFGDLEFESYRRLGQYLVDRALAQQDPAF